MLPMIRTLLILGCGFSTAMACDAPSGSWRSSEGTIHFPKQPSASIYARYSQDDGRLLVQWKGQILDGAWVEKSSAKRCDTAVDGSRHWGRVRFVFDPKFEQFTGQWSYCDAPLGSTWTGQRLKPCKVVRSEPTLPPISPPPPKVAQLLDIAFVSAKTGKRYGLHDALSPSERFRILATYDMKPELPTQKVLLAAEQTGDVRLSWYPAKSPQHLVSGDVSRSYVDGEWLTASFKGKTTKIQVKKLNAKMSGARRVAWGSKEDYSLSLEHNGAPVPWFPSVTWSVDPPVVGIKGYSQKAQLILPKNRDKKQLVTITAKASGQSRLGKISRVVHKQVLIGSDEVACKRLDEKRTRFSNEYDQAQRNLRSALAELDALPRPSSSQANKLEEVKTEVTTAQAKVSKLQKVVDELSRTRQLLQNQQRSLAFTQVKLGRAMTDVARMYATKSWYPSSSGTSRYAQWIYMQGVLGAAAPRNLRAKSWQADMEQASVKAARAKFVILGKAFVDLGGLVMLVMPTSNLTRLASQASAIKNLGLFAAGLALDEVMNTSVYLDSLRSDISALQRLGNDMAQLKTLAKAVENGKAERGKLNQQLVKVYQRVLAARLRIHQRHDNTGTMLTPIIKARNQEQQLLRQKQAQFDRQEKRYKAVQHKDKANAAKRQILQGKIRPLRSAASRVARKSAQAEKAWHQRCHEPSAIRIETDKRRYNPNSTMKIRVYGDENIPADAVIQVYPANKSVAPSNKGYAVWPNPVLGLSTPKATGKYTIILHSPRHGMVSKTSFTVALDLNGLWRSSSRAGAHATIRFIHSGNNLVMYVEDAKTLARWGFADGEKIGSYTLDGNTISGASVLRYPVRFRTLCPEQYEFIAKAKGKALPNGEHVTISWMPDSQIDKSCKVTVLKNWVETKYVRVGR